MEKGDFLVYEANLKHSKRRWRHKQKAPSSSFAKRIKMLKKHNKQKKNRFLFGSGIQCGD